ncbi:hypothetical protein JTL86_08220 [Pseudomonas aeruginosa]|nr:hypothetical protein [Pseudomonas aeruginosa]
MRSTIYNFTGTNNRTGFKEVDFNGTELEYANLYADKDYVYSVGYPLNLIEVFKKDIIELESRTGSRNYDDETIAVYQKAIGSLEKFIDTYGVRSPAIITNWDELEAVDILSIDPDLTVKKEGFVKDVKVGVEFFANAVKANNIANDSEWFDWNNAEEIIEAYTQDDRSNYIFVGGRANVTKELEVRLKEESRTDHILNGYISGSVPRKELLTMAKSLSDNQLIALEDKLGAKGIDLNKFQNDLKSSAPKFKP